MGFLTIGLSPWPRSDSPSLGQTSCTGSTFWWMSPSPLAISVFLQTLGVLRGAPPPHLNSITFSSEHWGKILAQYPGLTSREFHLRLPHSAEHTIPTSGLPVAVCPRRLSPQDLALAKKLFAEYIRLGIMPRSSSQYQCLDINA